MIECAACGRLACDEGPDGCFMPYIDIPDDCIGKQWDEFTPEERAATKPICSTCFHEEREGDE
jgi:hypothetical protein